MSTAISKDAAGSSELYQNEHRWREEYGFVVGVDEAGRGPLAGPVVAAAVVIPQSPRIPGINDSKKLSPKSRERLYAEILATATAFGVGIRSSRFIDRFGIAAATFAAMKDALSQVLASGVNPGLVMVDGYEIRGFRRVRQKAFVDGDATYASIACASIIAKVIRDRIMKEFDSLYPEFGLMEHKGYGTRAHLDAILASGPSPIHRMTFKPLSLNTVLEKEDA